jgi:hypothetical protein
MQDEISTLQGTISKIEETKEDEIRGVRVELDEVRLDEGGPKNGWSEATAKALYCSIT